MGANTKNAPLGPYCLQYSLPKNIKQMTKVVTEGKRVNRYQVYSKTCVKRPLAKRPKIGFQDLLSLNAGQKKCRSKVLQNVPLCSKGSILQYFPLSLSYHLSIRSIFEWRFYTGFTVYTIHTF